MVMMVMMMMTTMMMNNEDDDENYDDDYDDENDDDDYDDDDHPLPFHCLSLFSKPSVSIVHENLLMTSISHLNTYKQLVQGAHVFVQGLVEGSYTLERSTIS